MTEAGQDDHQERRRPAARTRRGAPAGDEEPRPSTEAAEAVTLSGEVAAPRRRRPPRGRGRARRKEDASEPTGPKNAEPSPDQHALVASAAAEETEAPALLAISVLVPRGWARRMNATLVQAVVERALRLEQWDRPAAIDVLMVRDDELREVNATRRGIDEPTDVLSFPLVELKPGVGLAHDFFVLPPEATLHLGDVVLSVDRVEAQAREAGHSPERELAYLTVHGVLHILGYDHDTEVDRRRMRKREEEVLGGLGLTREDTAE